MPEVTVITPTTGRPSLRELVASIDHQSAGGQTFHILLWDDVREPAADAPESFNSSNRLSLVLPKGFGRQGNAPGSRMRAVGLMLATTRWVTFADDDVRWNLDHLEQLLTALQGVRWASTLRTIWSPSGERLGVDRFESVGDDPRRRVPYEMCDNNCMIFERSLGSAAAVLYRETNDYNDDRLMYGYLKAHAGRRGATNQPTVHQYCPGKLIEFFRTNCSPE